MHFLLFSVYGRACQIKSSAKSEDFPEEKLNKVTATHALTAVFW